jgi:hypothetical protein
MGAVFPDSFPEALRNHAANIGLLILALIVMFWRVFLLGNTLADVNTLNNQLPWGYGAGPSDYPYNRRDLTDTYITREFFVVQSYRDGELPLWNPYTMAGHPIYADGVTRTLSPSLLWYLLFDVPLGYSIARIAELMAAAIFMYLFLLAIGVGPRGALIGALIFELSAHSMLHLTGLGWWGGLMWLPLVILFADRALKRNSVPAAVGAGLLLAAQFFCGYLPNQVYYVAVLGLYYVLTWWLSRRREASRVGLSRVVFLAAVSLATGLVLAATQWIPSLELLGYSNRKVVGSELGYVYLPPWYALTLIFPNIFGSAYDTKTLTLFTALGVSHDHILYIGVSGLVAAGFAVCWLRWRGPQCDHGRGVPDGLSSADQVVRVQVFTVILALSLVLMMTTPVYVLLTRFVPILKVIRVSVRAGVLFQFAASALAAYGVELLLSAHQELLERMHRVARRLAAASIVILVLGFGVAAVLKVTGFTAEAGHGKIAFLRKSAAVLSDQFFSLDRWLFLPILFTSLLALVVWLYLRARVKANAVFVAITLLLLVDLFSNGIEFNRSFERSRVFPRTEITDFIKSLPPGRVLVTPSDLETNRRAVSVSAADKIIAPPNTLLPYEIPTVSGKNQQFPKWYREYAALIEPQNNLSHVVFDRAQSPFFDLLNVRYVLTHAGATIEGYQLRKTAEGISVYENPRANPRAFFAGGAVGVAGPADALELLRSSTNPPDVVPIEDAGAPRGISKFAVGKATIIKDARNSVQIETENEGEGLLVLSDNFYPGWKAAVDGSPVEILRANRTMRAVTVPAGRHMVSFEFKPASFWITAFISAIAAVALLVWLVAVKLFNKRSPGRDKAYDLQ